MPAEVLRNIFCALFTNFTVYKLWTIFNTVVSLWPNQGYLDWWNKAPSTSCAGYETIWLLLRLWGLEQSRLGGRRNGGGLMPQEHLHNFMSWTWAGFRPVTFCFAPLLLPQPCLLLTAFSTCYFAQDHSQWFTQLGPDNVLNYILHISTTKIMRWLKSLGRKLVCQLLNLNTS